MPISQLQTPNLQYNHLLKMKRLTKKEYLFLMEKNLDLSEEVEFEMLEQEVEL